MDKCFGQAPGDGAGGSPDELDSVTDDGGLVEGDESAEYVKENGPTEIAVQLPPVEVYFGKSLTEVRSDLEALGLNVDEGVIGCSHSTERGLVRQVTAGLDPNVSIHPGWKANRQHR